MPESSPAPGAKPTLRAAAVSAFDRLAPGFAVCAILAMAAMFVTDHYGGPQMLYALLFGIALNFLSTDEKCAAGVAFSARTILKIGVALLGARITFSEVMSLGAPVVVLVACGVVATIAGGAMIGRAFGLKPDHAVLSAGAVAICGASAALAISSVLPNHKDSERNTILTVVGVTTMSTLAMMIYPIVARMLGFTETEAGVFIGATIHDVAQVMGAGYMISDDAGNTAAIVKLMRVLCLLPAVVVISMVFKNGGDAPDAARPPLLPSFLIGFTVLMLANSTGLLPAGVSDSLGAASRWCLLVAVSALGVKTSLKDLAAVGPHPVAALAAQTLFLAAFAVAGIKLIELF
ncbi:MAG: putative sulfate exporter family transporter [Parvularculaceae bacterium]